MRPPPPRIYADTSVYGGVFDEEFAEPSRIFFDQVRLGRFRLVVASLVAEEIAEAPVAVQDLLAEMLALAEFAEPSLATLRLVDAYLDAGIVGATQEDDALHVALATTSGCVAIVSWNFRHIVHFDKVPRYNEVNVSAGFRFLSICSPAEVVRSNAQEDL